MVLILRAFRDRVFFGPSARTTEFLAGRFLSSINALELLGLRPQLHQPRI